MRHQRYARQIPIVGREGQARIEEGSVRVTGDGLASEVCVSYLAGSGIKIVRCCPEIQARTSAINSDVHFVAEADSCTEFTVWVGDEQFLPPSADDPVKAGASGARWALMRILSRPSQATARD